MPYLGNTPDTVTKVDYYYTATNNQTVFTGADNYGVIMSLNPGYTDVYLNGVLLNVEEFSANTTHITIGQALDAGDVVQVRGIATLPTSQYAFANTILGSLAVAGNTSVGGNLGVGTTVFGADGLSLAVGDNLSFAEGQNSSIVNLFRQTSSAATVLANGYKFSTTPNKVASSYSASLAKSAIELSGGIINFYGDTANTIASGTDATPTLRGRFSNDGNFSFDSGYGSAAVAYGCRAWVNFNGTGTVAIRGSGNITSITDHGIGDYTVNFTNAMPDTNFAAVGAFAWSNNGNPLSPNTLTTGGVRVGILEANAYVDRTLIFVAVFR